MNIKRTSSQRRLAIACLALGLGGQTSIAVADTEDELSDEHVLDELVITGVPLERAVKDLAQPTAVLTGEQLAKQQSSSLGETLSNELGVSSSYFGPIASRPVIRGQYGERIRVLSNSLDAMDASALSEDHSTSVDALLAERVEIVRGPATLLYGSGASGGLVNIVDNRIREEALTKPIDGFVTLGTDSATGKEAVAGEVAFGTENIAFHLDYFRRETDDVEIPGFAESAALRALEEEEHEEEHEEEEEEGHEHEGEEEEAFGVVENTAGETDGAAAAISFIGDNGFIGVAFSTYDSLYGIPGHHHHHEEEEGEEEEEHEEEEESVRIDMEQSRVDVRGEYQFANSSALRVKYARNDYEHVELEGDEIGTMFDSTGTDLRVEYRHQTFGNMDGAWGLQHKDIEFIAEGEEAFVPPSDTTETSLFAFEEWQLENSWTLQGSARFEQQSIDAPNLPSYDEDAFGVSIGAIYSFSGDYSLAANLALTERHPNATELYADGAHVAVERIERGSVTQGDGIFDKEMSSNVDVTLRGQTDRIEWSVTGFVNEVDDYIVLRPTGLFDVVEELQVYDYEQTDARLHGFEAEARIELFDSAEGHLHTRLFTDLVRGTDLKRGGNLPRITPHRYGIGLHYTRGGFEAAARATFVAEQDKIAENELPTDSYTLLSAEVSYAMENPQVFIFLRGTNLTDEDARQHTSPLKDIAPLPGRSLQLGLRYDF